MEPGGTEDAAWPQTWATRFDGAPVIDLQASAGRAQERFLGPANRLHPTWSAIIRVRLAYAGLPCEDSDVLRYQRERFGSCEGGEALLEISAYAAANLGVEVPRKQYLASRIERLRDLVREHAPEIVVCYGSTFREYFSRICGGPFDSHDDARWSGSSRCVMTMHPSQSHRPSKPPHYWVGLGVALRACVDERRSKSFPLSA